MPQPTIPETRRILLEASCLVRSGSLTVPQLARRMGVSSKAVRRDLQLLTLTGIPPYSPLELIEVDEDSTTGTLAMRQGGRFGRSILLTREEAEALAFAAGILGRTGRPPARGKGRDRHRPPSGSGSEGARRGRRPGQRPGPHAPGRNKAAVREAPAPVMPEPGRVLVHVRSEGTPDGAASLFEHDPAVESVRIRAWGPQPRQGILLELGCTDRKRLAALLVAMGGQAAALSPPDFVEDVRRLAARTLAKWSSPPQGASASHPGEANSPFHGNKSRRTAGNPPT